MTPLPPISYGRGDTATSFGSGETRSGYANFGDINFAPKTPWLLYAAAAVAAYFFYRKLK